MPRFADALLLALLPALGNIAGGLLAEFSTVSERTRSLALHAAAGVVLAVVAVELMPQAIAAVTPWVIVAAFVAGGGFFVSLDWALGRVSGPRDEADAGRPWMIFTGVAIDLFSDGVMIGTGTTLSTSLALLLALGQVPADIPEGFSTIAEFKRAGTRRRVRLLASAAFTIPILAGAAVGYFGVRGGSELLKLAVLAFTAGVLTTLVVEELVPEAHAAGEARFGAMTFVGGFALFTLLSAYLG